MLAAVLHFFRGTLMARITSEVLAVRQGFRTPLERNRGRNLEGVSLESGSALEFTKVFKADAGLLLM